MEIVRKKEDLKKETGQEVNKLILKYKNNPILLLLSGGSALDVLDYIDVNILGPRITIGMIDERFSFDRDVNNFAKLSESKFLEDCMTMGCAIIGTEVQRGQTVSELSQHLERSWTNWDKRNKDGKVIVVLGLGEDGHTAGIMPYPENPRLFRNLFEQEDDWVVGYDAKDKNKYSLRITATISFLKDRVDEAVVFVSGQNKKEALEKVQGQGSMYKIPGRIFQEMKNVRLFTNIV